MFRTALLLTGLLTVGAHTAFSHSKPQLRLLDNRTHDLYLSFWPKTNDVWLGDLKKKDLLFYDDRVMPPAYQAWNGALHGIHSPSYNVSAERSERFGNANREFPWGAPAGLHDSPNFKAFRFVHFPAGKPIVWWRERLYFDDPGRSSYVWKYPVGTTFGEILLVSDAAGYDWTFELRTRTRSDKGWRMNAFRPFPTQADLAERIKELVPKWRDRPELVRIIQARGKRAEPLRLVNVHELVTFDATSFETPLPAIDKDLVRKLLDTPFKSALGQVWTTSADGLDAFAPTTAADFHIVPKNYQGGFVEVSSKSCMRCHDTTLKHAGEFQFSRDWYGRVRGADGIFSFHIFDPGSISHNGIGAEPALRVELVKAGMLKERRE